ncbi:hypothetical protein ACFXNW_28870 [Nocardia sp. NPDC059180]|uniref:hypothetical protein n=1 Tax=Nocardia sp. NPDC059180 TaxID=3346761 RepID=UPI0036AD44C2
MPSGSGSALLELFSLVDQASDAMSGAYLSSLEVCVSTAVVASGIQITAWSVFWMQLPVLVLVVAVIVVAITALRRARAEDVPRVFEAFAIGFGRRLDPAGSLGRRPAPEVDGSEEGIR